eukprot:TRINITY_DN1665_c0_g1_i1.p1 TRINITY_DN1665_c0_g1~~TRINITY_DN1665_c0_g1_i1.p1  ORF type:complete len:214 (+),score=57.25 TRINITY_DN1665_c0_g1_i1:67-708(+)
MTIAKILLKLAAKEEDPEKRKKMEEEAIDVEKENIELFEITCGEDSPLTASALKGYGEALLRRLKIAEAIPAFAKSYLLEAKKDAFDLLAVMEVHNCLFGAHMAAIKTGKELDRKAFRSYMPTIEIALTRVRGLTQDANAGAYFKVAGEMMAFAEDYAGAYALLGEAIELLNTETPDKVGTLVKMCQELQDFCNQQLSQPTPSSSSSKSSSKR